MFLNATAISGQKIFLKINNSDSLDVHKIISVKKEFSDKPSCYNYINQLPNLLKLKGYISASVDSVFEKDNTIQVLLFVGNRYLWKKLSYPLEFKNFAILNNENYEQVAENILHYFETTGYPFAQISFDSIAINKNQISASIKIEKGIEYRMDSIRVFGNTQIKNQFLQHHLKIFNQELYNKEKLEKINDRLSKLNYLSSFKNWDLLMLNSSYLLNLYLQPKNINKFDAIFGFLPNNNQKNGKLLFTIDAKLFLENAFANGESISLNWQQIQPQSPRIDIGFKMPYIFNSDVGFNFNFNLYKRDSAFLNIITDVGIDYELTNKTKFKIFFNNYSTKIIDADTAYIILNKKLPTILDMNTVNLGVEYFYNNTKGSNINKTKGFDLLVSTSFGQKKIKDNTIITSLKTGGFNYKSLYDSINTNTYQIKTKLIAAKYFSLTNLSVLKLAANYGLILTKNYLQNEMYQIGGFKLLRGFDEENIFTNEYLVATTEYRYLIETNSFLYAFIDAGYTKNFAINKNYNYWGTGLGIALETKQGILNISFAAGKRNDLSFNLKETKIHVGLISNF